MKLKIEVSAGGIVFKEEKGKRLWLVIHHASGKHWSFPKGHVADKVATEKREEAALREVEEEGGVKAKIVSDNSVDTHYMYRRDDCLHKKTVHYFLMKYVDGDPTNHDHEVSEAKFLTEKEVKDLITYESDLEAFRKILIVLSRL